ncbi:hypothetical protein [Microbacterium sp. NIBRBAC000506063]|uniref:hypothetical protein n=1 Tax=Microbacterium sp. NIBRBAC000506063 TaxID=2734618 RepID=UPI002948BC25|nr:hypothetical protein [Microbacterium sp. NIBRBAC000506063]
MTPLRSMVLWVPDWPVFAAFGAEGAKEAVAVVHDNTVIACSAAARAQGCGAGNAAGRRSRCARRCGSSPPIRSVTSGPSSPSCGCSKSRSRACSCCGRG